ncbi:hypothetical protein M758_11G020700 [Ceratodon purpureus]|nr:hypothetical protein M758_11G020700 [Ceratodon purpureus]
MKFAHLPFSTNRQKQHAFAIRCTSLPSILKRRKASRQPTLTCSAAQTRLFVPNATCGLILRHEQASTTHIAHTIAILNPQMLITQYFHSCHFCGGVIALQLHHCCPPCLGPQAISEQCPNNMRITDHPSVVKPIVGVMQNRRMSTHQMTLNWQIVANSR